MVNMFSCNDKEQRDYFKSHVREYTKRNDPIKEFLQRQPWQAILKKEISYDSEDDNCTILKTLKQDVKCAEDGQEHSVSEEDSLMSRMECYHKLKDLIKFVPEVNCILNDLNYAPSEELELAKKDSIRVSAGDFYNQQYMYVPEGIPNSNAPPPTQEKVQKTNLLKANKLQDKYIGTGKEKYRSRLGRGEKTLYETLYENEEFAKILDGIVYKEILELIDYDGEVDAANVRLVSFEKRISQKRSTTLFKKSADAERLTAELNPLDEFEHISEKSGSAVDDYLGAELPTKPGRLESSTTGESKSFLVFEEHWPEEEGEAEDFDAEIEEEEEEAEEQDLEVIFEAAHPPRSKSENFPREESEYSIISTGESSSELSDPDALLRDLLGNLNYPDILDEWQVTIQSIEERELEKKLERENAAKK